MIETHLSLFDIAVTSLMLLSCIFAFYRGFVREVLSLSAWVGAGLVTIYYFPTVANLLKPHFKSEVGAAGVGTLGIYTLALLGFSIINMFIFKYLKAGSDVGLLDNTLGLAFGALRGAVIVSLGFFLYTIAAPEKDLPPAVQKSVTYPYVEKGAMILANIAPEYLREISSLQKKAMAQVSPAAGSQVVEPDAPQDSGYNANATNAVDQLSEKASQKP